MNLKRAFIWLFLMLLLSACKQEPNPKRLLDKTTIKMPKHYKLVGFKLDWAIGDEVEIDTMIVSHEDYESIKLQIREMDFFVDLGNSKLPNSAYDGKSDPGKRERSSLFV